MLFIRRFCTVEMLAFFTNEPKNAIIKSIRNLMRAFIKIEMWSIGKMAGWLASPAREHFSNHPFK